MSQLKPSFVQQIRDSLGSSKFTENDFSVELPTSGKALLKITFLYKPEYHLTVLEETRRESVTIKEQYLMSSRVEESQQLVFVVRSVPGLYKVEATRDIGNLGGVLEEIKEWCENVRADLYAIAPRHDPLKQLRDQLESKLEKMVQDPDNYFSEEELVNVDRGLDQIYADISKLREEHAVTQKQLAELKAEIDEFKNSARAYPKGIWAKVTSNRLVKATGKMFNTPEGRTFLFQQATRMLGKSDDA